MPIAEEITSGPPVLATSREPVSPTKRDGKSGKSIGDIALTDAVIMVVAAWAILFLLAFSLRSHNI